MLGQDMMLFDIQKGVSLLFKGVLVKVLRDSAPYPHFYAQ